MKRTYDLRLFACVYPGCEREATHYFVPTPPFASTNPDKRMYVCFHHIKDYIFTGVCRPGNYFHMPSGHGGLLWYLRNSFRMGEWAGRGIDNSFENLADHYQREDHGIPEDWKP